MYCCLQFLHIIINICNYNIHTYLTPTYTKGRLCYSVCLGVSLTRSELSERHSRIFLRFTCVVRFIYFVAEGVGGFHLCLIEQPSRSTYFQSISCMHRFITGHYQLKKITLHTASLFLSTYLIYCHINIHVVFLHCQHKFQKVFACFLFVFYDFGILSYMLRVGIHLDITQKISNLGICNLTTNY